MNVDMNELMGAVVRKTVIETSISSLVGLLQENKIPFNDPKILRQARKLEKLLASHLARFDNNLTGCDE